jgi:superfamily II helicase
VIDETSNEIKEDLIEREIWNPVADSTVNNETHEGLCKHCYDKNVICPLVKNLTEKNKNRYIDCEETDEELEEEHDMLIGSLETVLGKLEEKGQEKDITIDKY